MKVSGIIFITLSLLSGCTLSQDKYQEARSDDSRFDLFELKDTRNRLTGISGIFVDLAKRTYGINDRSASFSSCDTDINATLRLICGIADAPVEMGEERSTEEFGADRCSKFSLGNLLHGRVKAMSEDNDAISGIVVCADSATHPTTKISAVITGGAYITAIYVENFDSSNGRLVQEQTYIAVGQKLRVKEDYRID